MIDPAEIITKRVGQLPVVPFSLTDKLPKENGSDLGQDTINNLADFIGSYIGTTSSLAFNPTTVNDGGTLPVTSSNEWMLVGKGTFHNVGGGADIITTEELNAVTSNGSYWSLAVQISTDVSLAIVQTIRSGFTTTSPSEDAVFKALALKADANTILTNQIEFTAIGGETTHDIGTDILVKSWFWDGSPQARSQWSQSGSVLTFAFPLSAGSFNIFI